MSSVISPMERSQLSTTRAACSSRQGGGQAGAFDAVLADHVQEQEGVQLSAHAQRRLQARRIDLTQGQLSRLGEATTQAAAKGARESLILLDNLAFVVSVASRTVVTAMERAQMEEGVFTNIDSAVVNA